MLIWTAWENFVKINIRPKGRGRKTGFPCFICKILRIMKNCNFRKLYHFLFFCSLSNAFFSLYMKLIFLIFGVSFYIRLFTRFWKLEVKIWEIIFQLKVLENSEIYFLPIFFFRSQYFRLNDKQKTISTFLSNILQRK